MTGYLPSLVTGETPFKGNSSLRARVGSLLRPGYGSYDSPLPQRFDPIFAESQTKDFANNSSKDEDRKSFLATPLFL